MSFKKESGNKKVVKGFTLVEIIVVLVILAILAAATIPSLLGFIDDAKFKTIDNEARVVRNAAQAYATEQSANGKSDGDIQNAINGVINSDHALHSLLQNDANGTVFETKVEKGKIKKFNYTKEIIDQNEDIFTDKVRYVMFDDEKTSLLHATGAVTTIDAETFKANIIAEVTAALKSDDPESLKSTLTSSLNSSLDASVANMETTLNSSIDSKIAASKTSLKTNFRTELGSNVVDLVYPVGSYYVSHSSTSPATLFPGTTWTQITNKFLYCAESGAGDTGGSSTHTHSISGNTNNTTLTIDQIPSHNHTIPNHAYNVSGGGSDGGAHAYIYGNYGMTSGNRGGGKGHNHAISITSGLGSNMPPYVTVYCWRRTT